MAVVPERWRSNLRGGAQPVRLDPGQPRLGFKRWYKRARTLGWPVRKAFGGAFTYGR